MTYDPLSRRLFVGTGAAALGAVWLTGASGPWLPTAAGVLPVPALRDVDAISALILPSDDLPGAREAKVVDFIDRAELVSRDGHRTPLPAFRLSAGSWGGALPIDLAAVAGLHLLDRNGRSLLVAYLPRSW